MPVLPEGYPMHTPNVTCPRCDDTNVDEIERKKYTTVYRCRTCGHEWEEYR